MNSAIAFILASMCFWNCQNEKPEEGGGSTTSDADLYIECPGKVNVRTDPETGGSQVIKFIIRKSGLGAAEARIDVMTTSELRQKIGSGAASYTVIPDNAYNISVGKVEFSDTESEKSVTVTVDRGALAGLIDYAPGKFTCLPIAVTSQDASVTSDMDYVVFVFRPDDGYHFSTWNYEGISASTDIDQAVKDWKDEDEVRAYLQALLDKKAFDQAGLIYGMGHAVYSLSDPRANLFQKFVEKLSREKGRNEEYELYSLVARLGPEVISGERKMYKGVSANVDFYSGFVYHMLDLPLELYTPLFAMARVAGWSAHRMEELINMGKIIRPAYKYVGSHTDYVPMDER